MVYKAKKSLGQNFLKNKGILQYIIQESNINQFDTLLEIGPGLGSLTELLLKANPKKLICVEKDIELFNILSEKYSSYIATGQLLLINGDILSTNIEDILKKLHIIDYKLIANIPYYITGAILEMFLSINIKPEYMLLMMQKEVGERIINKGGKNSILSLATMLYADSKILKVVHKGSFSPVPKVDSVLIKITLKKDLKNKYIRIGENGKFYWDWEKFEKTYLGLIKAGLAHKRKKLITNLREFDKDYDWVNSFNKINITDNIRGEDMDYGIWIKMVEKYLDDKVIPIQ